MTLSPNMSSMSPWGKLIENKRLHMKIEGKLKYIAYLEIHFLV